MKKFMKHMGHSGIAMIITICLVFGLCATGLVAQDTVKDGKTINYVSLGASNVNGYGLRGYLPMDQAVGSSDKKYNVYKEPWTAALIMNEVNIYGYKQNTPASYPVLIQEYFENQGYNVNLSQLAISSMRVEEVRFLLDDTYMGDGFTDWRFYNVDGKGSCHNWFKLAGELELKLNGKESSGYDDAVNALKAAYRKAVEDADYLTFDLGMNNFGVYVSNELSSPGYYGNDLNTIDPELAAQYEEGKAYVKKLVDRYIGADFLPADTLNHIVDTMAYALVGYCTSFDATMAKIYELNPDIDITVVSIQNLMHGLNIQLPGGDQIAPLGDLFGAVINAANIYTASLSPYCDTYTYADVRQDGHVELYSDAVLKYNGDPRSLSDNMKDCYDVYDLSSGFSLKIGIMQQYAGELAKNQLLDTTGFENIGNTETFIGGLNYNAYKIRGTELTLPQFIEIGASEEGFSVEKYGPYAEQFSELYAIYDTMLYTAYDVYTEVMKAGAELDTLDFAYLGTRAMNTAGEEVHVANALSDEISTAIGNAIPLALQDEDYNFDLDEVEAYAECGGFFNYIAAKYDVPESAVNSIASLAVRTSIGNSFYGHPTPDGHLELKETILNAYNNGITGKDVVSAEAVKLYEWLLEYAQENYPEVVEALEAAAEYLQSEEFAILVTQLEDLYTKLDEDTTPEQKAIIYDELNLLLDNILDIAAKCTNQKYVVTEDSYYVSIGDSTLSGYGLEGYRFNEHNGEGQIIGDEAPLLLAKKLYGDDYKDHFKKLDTGGLRVEDILIWLGEDGLEDGYYKERVLEESKGRDTDYYRNLYQSEVEKADLITLTLGGGNVSTYITRQMDQLKAGKEPYEMNWERYFPADKISEVEGYIEEVKFLLNGVVPEIDGVPAEELAAVVAESALYGFVGYASSYPLVIDRIHEINPDAHVVLVGYFNPIDTLTIPVTIEGETTEIPVGEMMNLLVGTSNLYSLSYALTHDNITYTDTTDGTTILDEQGVYDNASLLTAMFEKPWETHLGVEGHKYVADQIYNSISVDYTKVLKDAYQNAIVGTYEKCGAHYYVALGATTTANGAYVEAVANHFGTEAINLGEEGLTMEALEEYIKANAEDIAKATLITYNMDAAYFVNTTLGVNETYWNKYLSEEDLAAVSEINEKVLAQLANYMDAETVAMAAGLVENFVYAAVAYGVETVTAVETIQAINPEALVMVAGMYNPLQGLNVVVNEETIDLGEVFEYVIKATDAYYVGYAMLDGNVKFVDVCEAEAKGFGEKTINLGDANVLFQLVSVLMMSGDSMYANEAGHEYIVDQIIGSIIWEAEHNFVIENADKDGFHEEYCTKCGELREGWGEDCVYSDIDGHWAYNYIRYAYENNLMNGKEANLFVPQEPATRAQIITMLYRMETGEFFAPYEFKGENNFTDLKAGEWYSDAMFWALDNGILKGYEQADGTYVCCPNNYVTRQEMACLMQRYAGAAGIDVSASANIAGYEDATEIADWAKEAMSWMVAAGLYEGKADNTLAPKANTLRAEVAAIFYRYIENNF